MELTRNKARLLIAGWWAYNEVAMNKTASTKPKKTATTSGRKIKATIKSAPPMDKKAKNGSDRPVDLSLDEKGLARRKALTLRAFRITYNNYHRKDS
jgi:hypothetical protein